MSRSKPIVVKRKESAELLHCPFFGFPKQVCDTINCMAWNWISDESGYCNLIEKE